MFGTDGSITLTTADTFDYLNKIRRNMIGFDDWSQQFDTPVQNYPPYNTIKLSNHEYRVEVAAAGFKKENLKVYTQEGQLVIEGKKDDGVEHEYMHRGLAQRAFTRAWSLPEELVVKKVDFRDGLLLIDIEKVIPKAQQRKDWL